ncbi:DUF6283 family protein [Streptomyces sp. NPDC001941]|uniref:DUF6283 family protein n=1 Tax=Streptomyces sp. NPDC001941 TaxID=3154659 RepID=UPI0033289373
MFEEPARSPRATEILALSARFGRAWPFDPGAMMTTRAPAPSPCDTCPYRKDVPSGVWAADEYLKMPAYDGPTETQDRRLWRCHQHDRQASNARVCAGWVATHDTKNLLALRVAVVTKEISPETFQAILNYATKVPVFASGAEAAAHGLRDEEAPGRDARQAISKLRRTRNDLT